ncbi:MAG: type II toxin-antitoxin system VapC family toxin [Lachnospiraceae bacterium]|nr:type II toxin-antitoxin system VapC family toxin [Lachnospiraceae bacterium]
MIYMLDTNICIYILKNYDNMLIEKFSGFNYGDICISSIVYSELVYGVEKSKKRNENMKNLLKFLSCIKIYDYDVNASNEYGRIRCALEKSGNTIGSMDMLIASHAKSMNMTIVTNNEREFSRVKGLKIENWVKEHK